jgi:hypothetical protein
MSIIGQAQALVTIYQAVEPSLLAHPQAAIASHETTKLFL